MNQEMDIDGWEFLPDDGFLDLDHLHPDDGEGKVFSGRRNSDPDPESVFNMNYFKIESPKSSSISNLRVLSPVPFQLEPSIYKATDDDDIEELFKGISKVPIDITLVPPPPPSIPKKIMDPLPGVIGSAEAEQDAVSQVFFKKTNTNEFVDMKMDSPRSGSRGISPQFDAGGAFSFEDTIGEPLENKNSPRKRSGRKDQVFWEDDSGNWEENSGGLNLWKWSLTGIGAICSFGVAAATIGIVIFASQQKNKNQQKLSFQIYTDDKRIKQVVQHAAKLNDAISAARGVPITRAHITFGGYYDSL